MVKAIVAILIILTLSIIFYNHFTIFVIPPIGASPVGSTLIISRFKTDFIDSPDAMCERIYNGANLGCRVLMLEDVQKNAKTYMRLPYSEWLYLISTNGQKYTF